MSVRINFTVTGLAPVRRERAAVVRALAAGGLGEARFDPQLEIFSLEMDPKLHSFADIRRVIAAAGELRKRRYLAVIMSP